MPQEKIIIKFIPDGHERLIKALNNLAAAQKKVMASTGAVAKATGVATAATGKASTATGILDTRGKRLAQTNGLLANSFATLRSKLLLVSFGTMLVAQTFGRFLKAAAEQEKALSQLDSILRSTGHAANITSIQLDSMAKGLAGMTRFGDEAIHSAEKLLLTFTNIKDDVFPDALGLTLDMAEAFGTDLKSSAIQLGKALNDPARGFTALRRIGVSFTGEQEKMIKNFVKTGDVASAQKVILEELKHEFGGISQNAGTLSTRMALLAEAWGDFQERLGESLEPLLMPVLGFVTRLLNETKSESEKLLEVLGTLEQTPMVKESQLELLRQQASLIEGTGNIIDVFAIQKHMDWQDATEKVRIAIEETDDAIKSHQKSIGEDTLAVVKFASGQKMTVDALKEFVRANTEAIVANESRHGVITETRATEMQQNLAAMGITDEMKQKILALNAEDLQAIQLLMDKKIALSDVSMKLVEMAILMGFMDENVASSNIVMKEWVDQWKMANSEIANAISAVEANWKAFDSAEKKKELATARTQRQKDAIETKYAKKAEDRAKKLKDWKIASAISNVALGITQTWRDETIPTLLKVILTAAQATAGYAQIATIKGQEFEQGGLIGGRRHSSGGTPIIAEQGEFIMSRSAVQSVGIENLNRMNEGGGGSAITVNVSGNVLSQDFVEGELAENIKEAVRRGTDFGIS